MIQDYLLVATRQDNGLGPRYEVYKGPEENRKELLLKHPRNFIIENYSKPLKKELDENPSRQKASKLVGLKL